MTKGEQGGMVMTIPGQVPREINRQQGFSASQQLQQFLSVLEPNEKLCALTAYFLGRVFALGSEFTSQVDKLLKLPTGDRQAALTGVICLAETIKCLHCTIINSEHVFSELIGKIASRVDLDEYEDEWWNSLDQQLQPAGDKLQQQLKTMLSALGCREITKEIIQRDLPETYLGMQRCIDCLQILLTAEAPSTNLILDVLHDIYWELNAHLESNHLREMLFNADLTVFEPCLITGINLLLHDLTDAP